MRVDRWNRPDFTTIFWQTHSIKSFFRAEIYLLTIISIYLISLQFFCDTFHLLFLVKILHKS